MMFEVVAAAAMMVLGGIGQAGEPDKPATPAEIATARTHADDLIRRAEAINLFDNITGDDGVPRVKHRASGMTCDFSGDDHDYIRVFPQAASRIPRGDDVGCGKRMLNAEHTTYATRYPDRHSAEDDLRAAVAAITQRLPDARPHEGGFPIVSRDGGATVLGALYDVTVGDKPRLTLVLVSRVGDWNLKHRATGDRPAGDAEGGDMMMPLVAGMSFMMSLPGERDRL